MTLHTAARQALDALDKISRWTGEFPDTGRKHEDGSTMSYAFCFGSNGERDFMRQVAARGYDTLRAALSAEDAQPVAWVLTEQLEKRETTCNGRLWFSDPVNSAWTPLYAAPTAQAAPATAPVVPAGRLHADGYFTWARRDGYAMDKKLPCDFYLAAPAAPAPAVQPLSEEAMKWRKAVQEAYGWLWHTNNEPMAPVPMWSPEQAAYQARKCLRELLTTAERGEAINAIAAHMDKIAGITAAPTKE